MDRRSSTGAGCFITLLTAPQPSGRALGALIGDLNFICILLVAHMLVLKGRAEYHLLLHWHGAHWLSFGICEPVAVRKVDQLYSRW